MKAIKTFLAFALLSVLFVTACATPVQPDSVATIPQADPIPPNSPTLSPESAEIEAKIQQYFSAMSEGNYSVAAEFLAEPEPAKVVIWSKEDFIRNYESGAKIHYTLLSVQDGKRLTNASGQTQAGQEVRPFIFPDENPRDCKTLLVEYQMDFAGDLVLSPDSLIYQQKAVFIKQGEEWRLRDFTNPSTIACQKLDGSYGQGDPTVTPYSAQAPMQVAIPTAANPPALAPALLGLSPEEVLKAEFRLMSERDFAQQYLLQAFNSSLGKMGYSRFVQNSLGLTVDTVVLNIRFMGICDENARQMPKATPTDAAPPDAQCLIYRVKYQSFFPAGWGAVPSGSVLDRSFWLIKENDEWRIRDQGVG